MNYNIQNYSDFCTALFDSGFSMGGGNSEGVFAVIPWGWDEIAPYQTNVRWHTGDAETDPWEWRMRVLDERDDIAYAKLFFNKSGFITEEWYPYFYALRRRGESFNDAYYDGNVSHTAKRIYDVICENGTLAMHMIKPLCGFGKEDKSSFDRAIIELQMKMFITMCGRQQKKSKMGMEYGWNSTVLCTVEDFWNDKQILKNLPSYDKCEQIIVDKIMQLNPEAGEKKIKKFIYGK